MSARTVPRRLVLVGSVVADVSLRVPRLPDRGGDLLATALSITAGGGMFVLRAAIDGGLPSVYAGRHGSGPLGEIVRAALRAAGVDLAYDADLAGDTGPCVVLVEPDGERTMITANGVEAALDRERLDRLELRDDDAVYVSGYDLSYEVTGPAVAGWLPRLPLSALVIVDPGPLVADIRPEVLDPVLSRTDLLTLSASEARLLCGETDPDLVARHLVPRLRPEAVVVLRDGANGAALLAAGQPPQAVPVQAVAADDTTGAGDTHSGALVAARARGLPWPAAVAAANAATAAFLARRALRSLGDSHR